MTRYLVIAFFVLFFLAAAGCCGPNQHLSFASWPPHCVPTGPIDTGPSAPPTPPPVPPTVPPAKVIIGPAEGQSADIVALALAIRDGCLAGAGMLQPLAGLPIGTPINSENQADVRSVIAGLIDSKGRAEEIARRSQLEIEGLKARVEDYQKNQETILGAHALEDAGREKQWQEVVSGKDLVIGQMQGTVTTLSKQNADLQEKISGADHKILMWIRWLAFVFGVGGGIGLAVYTKLSNPWLSAGMVVAGVAVFLVAGWVDENEWWLQPVTVILGGLALALGIIHLVVERQKAVSDQKGTVASTTAGLAQLPADLRDKATETMAAVQATFAGLEGRIRAMLGKAKT